MTIVSTANTLTAPVDQAPSVLAELISENSTDIAMMIGVGLVKDSDAVFFQYVGDKDTQALMLPSGKPLTRIQNVKLTGISIAEDVGAFKSTKLNIFLTSHLGRTVMLTSGLTTMWSQCVLGGLIGMFATYDLSRPFDLESWYGTSQLRPVFAAIKLNGTKVSDNDMYTKLAEARSDRDKALIERIMRDAVDVLRGALGVELADVVVNSEPSTENTEVSDLF